MAPYLLTERVRKACRSLPNGLPEAIEHLLVSIQLLNERITKADAELAKLAEEHPTCKLLMTIPGIGPVTTLRFVAALDRVDRFPSAHAVQAFLGLVPGENSSSTRKQRTGITKAGPPRVRWALVQATSSFRRTSKNDPLVDWALEVEKR